MDVDDMTKNPIYIKGFQDGLKYLTEYQGEFNRTALKKLYTLSARKRGSGVFTEALYFTSSLYAHLYNTHELFDDMYRRGRLLIEPEIRFGRVAHKVEQLLPMGMLHSNWEKEIEEGKEDM